MPVQRTVSYTHLDVYKRQAILKLMGYKMTDLSGSFPNAQLNKASELGLRNQVDRSQDVYKRQ